MVHTEADVIVH